MASPLRWFRKNQKVMLIVFGVSLMVVFLLPQLFDSGGLGGGGGAKAVTVAQLKSGPITDQDLEQYQFQHASAHNFLLALQDIAQREACQREQFKQLPQVYERVQTGSLSPENLNLVFVRRMLFVKEAQELGILISDDAIVDYISQISGGRFKSELEIDGIAQDIYKGRRNFESFKNAIKEDLMFTRMQELAGVGLPALPNVNRGWQMFKKLNMRVEADVLELSIDDEIAKISDTPSDRELRSIYEEGQYDLPDSSHQKPGFKLGSRVAAEWFEADFTTFLTAAENDVLPEAIEAEYKRLVELNSDIVVERIDKADNIGVDMGDDQTPSDDPSDTDDGSATENDEGVPVPPNADPDKVGDPSNKTSDTEDADTEDADAKDADAKDADADADTDKKSDGSDDGSSGENNEDTQGEEGDELESDDDQNDESSLNSKPSVHFVSTGVSQDSRSERQDEESEQSNSAQDASDQDASDQDASDQDASDQDTSEKTADEKTAGEDQSAENQDSNVDASGQNATEQEGNPELDEIKIRPLAEVADQIRTLLAIDRAKENLSSAMFDAEEKLLDFSYDVFSDWEEENQDAPDGGTDRPIFAAQAVADELGLKYNSSKLISIPAFLDEEIAKKLVSYKAIDPRTGREGELSARLANVFLSDFHNTKFYSPKSLTASAPLVAGYGVDKYLIWTTRKANTELRSFKQAKAAIIKYWKRQQAVEKLMERGKGIVSKLGSKKLNELYADEAKSTGGFTWHSQALQGAVSNVPNVKNAGEGFMEAAFSLKPGEAAVAANFDNTAVYVVQVASTDTRSEKELKDQFYRSFNLMNMAMKSKLNFPSPIRNQHQNEVREVFSEWDQHLREKYELKWLSQ